MSEEDIKYCKYDGNSKCAYTQNFGKEEPDLVDCLLCSGAGYASVAVTFMQILSAVGAGQFGRDFLTSVVDMEKAQKLRLAILEKERPEYMEIMKKCAGSRGVGFLTPEELPEYLKRAFEKYQKRGDSMRV